MQTLPLGAVDAAGQSLAVSDDGQRWAIVNATPELGLALRTHPMLRDAPLGVVLLDARIEHVAGLLSLRDGAPIEVWATPNVFEDLTTGLPLLTVLQHYCGVRWHVIPVAGSQRRAAFAIAALPGLVFHAEDREGAAPPYSARPRDEVGNRIALRVEDLRDGSTVGVDDGTSTRAEGLADAA